MNSGWSTYGSAARIARLNRSMWPIWTSRLAWPILHKAVWPKIRSASKRAITAEEHAAIIASEKNPERRAYYELLYETGAAQTDAANLTKAQIDWRAGVLNYRRQKLGPLSEPLG